MTWDEVVRLGRTLPEVELATSYGTPALKLRGKLITRLRDEDDSLVLIGVPSDERTMLIEAAPDLFHVTPHYAHYPAVLLRLAAADADTLRPFIERRWRALAPKRLQTHPGAPRSDHPSEQT